jgi:hypothetical protein
MNVALNGARGSKKLVIDPMLDMKRETAAIDVTCTRSDVPDVEGKALR